MFAVSTIFGVSLASLALIPVLLSLFTDAISGFGIAFVGVGVAIFLAGVGSSIGVGIAGEAAAGVIAEDPDKFGRLLLLQALPGTQGVYGFIAGFLALQQISGIGAAMSVAQGRAFLFACAPVAIACLVSGVYQGRCSVAAMQIVAKRPEESGKALILPALVEFYAVLGLLGTILLLQAIR
jgi:V/A-type H+-transporting ATPase subunit K